jgi:hypothetical protein
MPRSFLFTFSSTGRLCMHPASLPLSALVLLLHWAATPPVAAQGRPTREDVARCITVRQSASAAMQARDWVALERFAQRIITTCQSTLAQPYYRASEYSTLAMAQVELGKATAALATSNRCLDETYAEPNCHVTKVDALILLRRTTEAKSATERAMRVTTEAMARVEREHAEGTLSDDVYQLRLDVYKSYWGAILSTVRRLFEPPPPVK